MTGTDLHDAYKAWTEHRYYRYRGCAPDPENPARTAGDPDLSPDAWHGVDRDGAEPQKDRRAREAAAKAVCGRCPVAEACGLYANTVTSEGRLAEPSGVWGGRTAAERRDAFRQRRHQVVAAAPEMRFRTPQKRAVLLALAMSVDAEAVAAAAGMDLRTANWQRSRIVALLSLDKTSATRRQVLAEAVRRGLLDAAVVVADDGTVPAVPPPLSTGPAPAPVPVPVVSLASPVQLSFPLFFSEPVEAAA